MIVLSLSLSLLLPQEPMRIGVIDGLRFSGQAPVHTNCMASTPAVASPLSRNRPYQVGVRSCF